MKQLQTKNNSGGINMSRATDAYRRTALLSGSSLLMASLVSVMSGVAVAIPDQAWAANECPPPATPLDNGAAADSFTCPAGDYPDGITYSSAGDLAVVTAGDITTNAEGVDLVGNGSDSVTWDSTTGLVTATAGEVIEVTTDTGDITINAAGVGDPSGFSDPASHGIKAASNGGNILITGGRIMGPQGVGIDAATTDAGAITIATTDIVYGNDRGIRAVTETGDINVVGWGYGAAGIGVDLESAGGDIAFTGVVSNSSGDTHGIRAVTTGEGDLSVDGSGFGFALASTGVYLQNETGAVNFTGSAFGGTGIKVVSQGDVTLTVESTRGYEWSIDVQTAAGSAVNLVNIGTIGETFGSNGYANNAVRIVGGALDWTTSELIRGVVDLSGTASAEWTIDADGHWGSSGVNLFSAGSDTLSVSAGGIIEQAYFTFSSPAVDPAGAFDFGGGLDTFSNGGTLVVGQRLFSDFDEAEGELQLLGLETLRNSGTIMLGGFATETDRWFDDILVAEGADYIGEEGRIVFDVDLNSSQDACDAALRNDAGDMPAADCVRLVGGTTSGTTYVLVNDIFQGDRGVINTDGIVLVDVSGGESHAGDFVLDSESDGYSDANGGTIDKGLLFYSLVYKEEDQQHVLLSLPGENAMQFPIVVQAAQALWRTATGTWFERQADLRGDGWDVGYGGGVWLRTSADFADRETLQSVSGGGNTFEFPESWRQNSYSVTGGIDLVSASTETQAFVLGLMAGYTSALLEPGGSPNSHELNGWMGGVYGSFVSGPLFVDASIAANKNILESDVPGLNIFPEGSLLRTDILSVGVQLEAGWRIQLAEGSFIEPLANVSYVRTSSEELAINSADASRPGIIVDFDDPASLRAALGARLGLEQDYGPVRAQFSLLGRVWNEFSDETVVNVMSIGADTQVADEFSGQFSEFAVGTSLSGLEGAVSGFLNLGGKFGDEYTSQNLSAGVRVNW